MKRNKQHQKAKKKQAHYTFNVTYPIVKTFKTI